MTTTDATTTYAIDPAHSSVDFSVRHLMLSKVRGSFRSFAGTITMPADGIFPSAITADVEVDSIDTREPQRDGHLKSEAFFHAEQHTHMHFVSTSVTPKDATHFEVAGSLEIRGITRPVVFTGEAFGRAVDARGSQRIAFEATARIDRRDFDMSFNMPLDAGGVVIGEHVDIELQIQGIAQA